MCKTNDGQRLGQAADYLSSKLKNALLNQAAQLTASAQEIRLRVNKPVSVSCADGVFYLTKNGGLSISRDDDNLLCTPQELENTLHKICDYSVYARQGEINRGFVTLSGGHRAGLCGTAVIENGKIVNVRQITSINIRIAREHKNCANQILSRLNACEGLLICGAPCSGKTTLLRDIARQISAAKKVILIDERGELAGKSGGGFQNDIGMCDVFDGYPKPTAISQAVRSMSPDVVICDEIGSAQDAEALALCKNSGVSVIASVHASSRAQLCKKRDVLSALRLGVFPKVVFLSGRQNAGRVSEIICGDELYAVS